MEIDTVTILVRESLSGPIIFELDHHKLKNPVFIKAKEKCNSRFLTKGIMPKFICHKDHARPAEDSEVIYYNKLKNGSVKC